MGLFSELAQRAEQRKGAGLWAPHFRLLAAKSHHTWGYVDPKGPAERPWQLQV